MNLSGVLVVARLSCLEEVVSHLEELAGVEVHQADAETGRAVVILEAEDIQSEIALLRQIKAVPHVIMAEMVYHYLADDEKTYDGMPAELAEEQLDGCAVPAYLND